MNNYPDDIHDYDTDPRSPFYIEPPEPQQEDYEDYEEQDDD